MYIIDGQILLFINDIYYYGLKRNQPPHSKKRTED